MVSRYCFVSAGSARQSLQESMLAARTLARLCSCSSREPFAVTVFIFVML
nr:MAG TPA: hypothetical protein [Caudoviricetes sp.]